MRSPSPSLPLQDVVSTQALLELLSGSGASVKGSLDLLYRRFGAVLDAMGSATEAVAHWRELGVDGEDDLFAGDRAERALRVARDSTARWAAGSWSILPLGSSGYPGQVSELVDAPPLLFVEGDSLLLAKQGVAVVGTRSATEDGIRRATRAAKSLVEAGFVVISGLAKGIDAAAHEGALAAGGLTLAVMGTPIDRRYPAENAELARRIIESRGALVSEFAPGTATQRWHFLRRNRTMSAIAAATLVVEAGETSGARSQAIAAIEHGRPVFLPESLVRAHPWARSLVEEGRDGVRAILVEAPEAIADVLQGQLRDAPAVTF